MSAMNTVLKSYNRRKMSDLKKKQQVNNIMLVATIFNLSHEVEINH